MLKALKYLAVLMVFAYPLIYVRGFLFPGIFPRAIFAYLLCELIFFLFLWYSLSRRELRVRKSYISIALVGYILIVFISAIFGPDFLQSFWSSYFRMTGLVTWLHYLSFFFVISALFTEEGDWRKVFRAIMLSGIVLALVSLLGADGLGVEPFALIKEGGSLFGNTSYSGAYYLLVFFMSLIGLSLENSRKWKITYLFALTTIFFNPDLFSLEGWLGLARASSLTLWGGVLVIAFLWLLHKFTGRKTVAVFSVGLAVLIFGLNALGLSAILSKEGKIYDAYLNESGPARIIVWDIAAQAIKDRPVLGYGAENFNYAYQAHFNPEIIHAEDSTEWFDNAHNFTLTQVLNSGFAGAIALLAVFLLVLRKSLTLYRERGDFYFLIIPFIFIFHFIQTQTFFQTDSALFLIFILLAFLVSKESAASKEISRSFSGLWWKPALLALMTASLYFFVAIPATENLATLRLVAEENRAERFRFYEKLNNMRVYPSGSLRLLSGQFMDNTAFNLKEIREEGLIANVADEYRVYLRLYEKYFKRHEDNYRYLTEYANLVNSAYVFGINELDRGESAARQALAISESFPHAYWMLAVNLHYQERNEEALHYAKRALEIDPSLEKSKEVYETIKR